MDLADRYRTIRAATEALAAPLSAEDCAIQSMEDASPVKWHLAHTSWFFETLILEGPGYTPFEPAFRVLFNSYYNSLGDQYDRPSRGLLSRPDLEQVLAYRHHVDEHVLARLATGHEPERYAVVELGMHHEQQHQELVLTDVKHGLSFNPWRAAYRAPVSPRTPSPAAVPLRWCGFDGGLFEIGAGVAGFAFDNERPRHRVFANAFELASRPVTNGEYLAFVRDAGYARPELWLADGWARVQREGWQAPLYWQRDEAGESWTTLDMEGRAPLDEAAPVCHVSGYEADAYARWADARLPTEAEWENAAAGALEGNFVESGALTPRRSPDLGSTPAALYGDVWEWTSSAYAPYPGFRPLDGSLAEYNGKFMSSQLVLRGGSCATPASHIRRSYRNFFYPHQRWQFSGIRLARDAA
jgi:ergothioneine biosynthesis protein EgtB